MTPTVSIVTPSFDQEAFLEETIRSVLDQDYAAIEYVVVDDGSRDGSIEIIRRYEHRLAWWTRQENAGQVAAINRGFARTSGEYMGFVNSDDTLLPGAVTTMVEALEGDPDLVMVYGDAVYTDADSRETGYLPSRTWDPPRMVRRADNHVVQPSSLWRRSAWEAAGPLNELGYYFFDFEFYLRLSALGPVRRLAQPLSTYREHAASKTMGSGARKAADYLRFADEFLAGEALPPELRPHARQGRSSAYIAAGDYLYDELDLPAARRALWGALALYPRNASRRSVSLALKSLLPEPAVRRLRARRRGTNRD
ncbi:MAG: glycosyltransferase family 2 protein [Gaiellaceae bacterium]